MICGTNAAWAIQGRWPRLLGFFLSILPTRGSNAENTNPVVGSCRAVQWLRLHFGDSQRQQYLSECLADSATAGEAELCRFEEPAPRTHCLSRRHMVRAR